MSKIMLVNSGVTQGSPLDLLLWNAQYDELLELEMPEGVTLNGFTDDIAAVLEA